MCLELSSVTMTGTVRGNFFIPVNEFPQSKNCRSMLTRLCKKFFLILLNSIATKINRIGIVTPTGCYSYNCVDTISVWSDNVYLSRTWKKISSEFEIFCSSPWIVEFSLESSFDSAQEWFYEQDLWWNRRLQDQIRDIDSFDIPNAIAT